MIRLAAPPLPPHWEPIDPAHGNTSLVLLDPASKPHHANELAEVKRNFTATGGIGTIRSVHRIQNAHLHGKYEAAKARLKLSGSPLREDVVVYHGTRSHAPELIHSGSKGFDPALGVARAGSEAEAA